METNLPTTTLPIDHDQLNATKLVFPCLLLLLLLGSRELESHLFGLETCFLSLVKLIMFASNIIIANGNIKSSNINNNINNNRVFLSLSLPQ